MSDESVFKPDYFEDISAEDFISVALKHSLLSIS